MDHTSSEPAQYIYFISAEACVLTDIMYNALKDGMKISQFRFRFLAIASSSRDRTSHGRVELIGDRRDGAVDHIELRSMSQGMFRDIVENTDINFAPPATRALGIAPLATVHYIETWLEKFRRINARVAAMALIVVGLPASL